MTIERCPEPVNFKKLFRDTGTREHPYPQQMIYKGKTISLVDKFPVKNKEILKFSIESVNSRYPQGYCISLEDGYFTIDGGTEKNKSKRMCNYLFYDDHEFQVFTKKRHVFIHNIWEETIYDEVVIDGTKPALENEKVIRYPEGKPVSCYINSGRWNAGLCNGSAMYAEDIPNGKRYHCNDGVEDDDFDDIVFTVARKLHPNEG